MYIDLRCLTSRRNQHSRKYSFSMSLPCAQYTVLISSPVAGRFSRYLTKIVEEMDV